MYSEQSPSALQAVVDFLWSPFRAIKYFYRDLSEIDERLRDDSIAVRALTIFLMPFRLVGGFLSLMVQNWPTSRSGFAAIAGIPAFFTLLGLLGAWVLVDYVRNDSWRISTNQAYFEHNVETHSENPESALAYAKKLVEIDPNDVKLKYQLGLAQERAGNLFAANDAMVSIAPIVPLDEVTKVVETETETAEFDPGDPDAPIVLADPDNVNDEDDSDEAANMMEAHIWRANYLARGKTLEEFQEVIAEAENHLQIAIAQDPERLTAKSQLANLYMNYAKLLDEESPERLEYLIKADETFREIIEFDSPDGRNGSAQITTLGPSVLVRKQLEAIDPEAYSTDKEIIRVRSSVDNFLQLANRYKLQDTRLWLILMNSAGEIRQFDFAAKIADQALKVVESPEGRRDLVNAKSFILQKAALSINNFDEFESYRDRFIYLCEAIKAAPAENRNYLFLLQFIGKENQPPSIQLARQLGLASPGDAVPINPEWLYRLSLEAEYTGIVTSMIGLQEFHEGDNEAGIKNWNVAQQFNLATREFIAKLMETMMLAGQDKLDHLDSILSESLLIYPEAIRMRMLRGLFYTKEKKFQQAIDDYRIVLESKPNEVLLHQRVKSCYLYLGQRQAAAAEQEIIDTKVARLPEERRLKVQEMLRKMENNQPVAVE